MSGDPMKEENLTPEQLAKKKENDAKKQAKLEKFLAKQEKQQAQKAKAANSNSRPGSGEQKNSSGSATSTAFVNTTVPGEKKDMSVEMERSYNPKAVESAWYAWWTKKGFFKPEVHGPVNGSKETYVIPLPPPNVTGSLHLGHALTIAVEDALMRWHRMHGHAALYIPGCDHAGIATQSVVEKRLLKEKGITRHDLGREAFLKEVWKWREQYGDRIYDQLKRMGGSFDWDRVSFTLDETRQKAVVEAFVRMHEDGIIYRDNRLVNWCGKLNTALSDQEVDQKELKGKTPLSAHGHDPKKKYPFGLLTKFAYKIVGSDEEIVVATTRPETIVGDTAVAVNPKDERYKKFHGKMLIHPFSDRKIPLVLDDAALIDFGTGAVKVTPAHDPTDFEIGKRHSLEFINILNDDNTLNENGGPFKGLPRFEARIKIVQALKEKDLYRGEEPNEMMLPICSRSGDIIEPRMKPQWWIRCNGLAEKAKSVVTSGEVKIQPPESEKIYFSWLNNIRDWCISRQLWWGHQIPAYRVSIVGQTLDGEVWVSGRDKDEAFKKAAALYPETPIESIKLEQDPDVLDTWFSSGLWPFSTLGWPEKTKDLELYYPNSVLETGKDILFFWVIRMIMMGTYFLGKAPFKEVFLHPMVRDAQGRKMSKSLGNVVDPIDVMEGISLDGLYQKLRAGNLDEQELKKASEGQKKDFPRGIPECGTDALRFGLCNYLAQSSDINLNILRIEGYRKFCNKLWNACVFTFGKLGSDFVPQPTAILTGFESPADLWVLSKLDSVSVKVDKAFKEYNFMVATSEMYSFWLNTFCGTYIEITKRVIPDSAALANASEEEKRKILAARNTLYTCLEYGLKLLHPFMPFITEELFQRMPRRPNDNIESICISSYPVHRSDWSKNEENEAHFDSLLEATESIRSLLANYNVGKDPIIYIKSQTARHFNYLQNQAAVVHSLQGKTSFGALNLLSPEENEIPAGCVLNTPNKFYSVFLRVSGLVDINVEIEKVSTKKEKVVSSIQKLLKMKETTSYIANATDDQKAQDSDNLKKLQAEMDLLTAVFDNLMKLK